MAQRALLGVVLGGAVSMSAAMACSNYVPPDVGTYGPPNGLAGKSPEPPSGGSGDDSSGSGSGSSSGGSDAGGSSSGGAAQVLCQTNGGTLVDAGACSVSFATDIYPKMQAGGSWGCAGTSCHATSTAPVMSGSTAASFYSALANYNFTDDNGVPYVNPCSTDPSKSGFVCNTLAAGSTGLCGFAMPQGGSTTSADQTMIATWVACGAPNN